MNKFVTRISTGETIKKVPAFIKLVGALFVSFLFLGSGMAQTTVSMSVSNCAVVSSTEIQFDVFVTNNGPDDVQYNSTVIRLTHAAGLLPATGTNNVTWGYVADSDFPLSFPASDGPTFAYFPATRLLSVSTLTGVYSNGSTCAAPNIAAGATAKIGRFFLRNSQAFTSGANVGITWNTTSGMVLYLACASTTAAYNTNALRTLDTPCTLTIPNADIYVSGNGAPINNGSTTTSTVNNTDYGLYSGLLIMKDFSIFNSGAVDVHVDSVVMSGPNASDWTVIDHFPPVVLAPGETAIAQIFFQPTTLGVKTATVNIYTDVPGKEHFTFRVEGNSVVLPVTLTTFTAEKNVNSVKLKWETTAELNNYGFEIERSTNAGATWEKIGFVAGAGNTSLRKNYQFIDQFPLKGNNQYRLKQVDFDRRSLYSVIRLVRFDDKIPSFSIYPTITQSLVTITTNDSKLINTPVFIVDNAGKIVRKILLTNFTQNLYIDNLPAGLYFIKAQNGDTQKVVKFK